MIFMRFGLAGAHDGTLEALMDGFTIIVESIQLVRQDKLRQSEE